MTSGERERRNQQDRADVESFVQKKVFLLGKYLALTEEMMACLEKNETEALGAFLSRRQQCLEEVDKIDTLLHRITQEQAGETSIAHDQDRIRTILVNVESLERELLRRMRKETQTLQGEIRKVQNARSAVETYRGNANHEPRFLDVRNQ